MQTHVSSSLLTDYPFTVYSDHVVRFISYQQYRLQRVYTNTMHTTSRNNENLQDIDND